MSFKLKCDVLVGVLNFISLLSSYILAWNSSVITQQNHNFKYFFLCYLFYDAPSILDYMTLNGGTTDE
jgi:hypothetical protein